MMIQIQLLITLRNTSNPTYKGYSEINSNYLIFRGRSRSVANFFLGYLQGSIPLWLHIFELMIYCLATIHLIHFEGLIQLCESFH